MLCSNAVFQCTFPMLQSCYQENVITLSNDKIIITLLSYHDKVARSL
jgi:hypothetical protein